MTATRTHRVLGIAMAVFVFVCDQALKWAVTVPLALQQRGQIELLSFFNLTWTENRGVSMGFLTAGSNGSRWLLVGFTAIIAACVAVWLWREKLRQDVIGLGLTLGGALGNIVDRSRFGYVVDFADLHFGTFRPFLIFNLADAAITIGVLILLARALLLRDKKAETETLNA